MTKKLVAKKDIRYPYTYAADYIRMIAGYTNDGQFSEEMKSGTKLSRSDAAKILDKIASIAGIDSADLAMKLADDYLKKQDDLTEKAVEIIVESLTRD